MWINGKTRVLGLTLLALVTLITLTLVSVSSEYWPSIEQSRSDKRRIEPVILVLKPTGFEPKEITRPRGLFLLVVNNRSNNPRIALRLEHESGRREYDQRIREGKIDWRQPLDLAPGRYVLMEPDHPEWRCHITITGA